MSRAETFAKIEALVNEAIKSARRDKTRFDRDAINWGDLSCHFVEWYEGSDGVSGYRAVIEEAAPGCSQLTTYVWNHLKTYGHDDVEVITQW